MNCKRGISVHQSVVRAFSPACGVLVAACLSAFGVLHASGSTTQPGESIPMVHVAPNPSGIEIGDAETHGPRNLLGSIDAPPDIPSGVRLSIRRMQPLHNKEPRYFIAASGRLDVVSIERPARYPQFEDTIPKWRTLLEGARLSPRETREILYREQLGEIPWMNAGRCFHAKLRHRTFGWGRAVLFLTTYVQGKTGGPVNNDMLVLVAQGLTADGRYAVRGHFEISHPKLPDSSWDEKRRGRALFDIDEETGRAEKWLDRQSDRSFAPSLSQYETFLAALQIEAPTR